MYRLPRGQNRALNFHVAVNTMADLNGKCNIDTHRDDYSCSATVPQSTYDKAPYISNVFFTNRYQLRMNAPVSFIFRARA